MSDSTISIYGIGISFYKWDKLDLVNTNFGKVCKPSLES